MAKSRTSGTRQTEPAESSNEASEFSLPIEPKAGRSAGSGPQARRLMIILAVALGMGAALFVWWLGSSL